MSISPRHFPCLILLPPTKKILSKDKLVIPIKEISSQYFRSLFHILKDIIYHSKEMNKYEAIKINFKSIIQYLEKNSNRISQQTTTKYQIQDANIFVNSKIERFIMTENNPSINISESNIASVTGEGKIDTAIANQHNYASEQKQTLAEAADEIQKLLQQLEQTNPTATEDQQIEHLNDETTPKFKRKAFAAFKAAGDSAIDEFLDNSYVKVGKAAIMGWMEAE